MESEPKIGKDVVMKDSSIGEFVEINDNCVITESTIGDYSLYAYVPPVTGKYEGAYSEQYLNIKVRNQLGITLTNAVPGSDDNNTLRSALPIVSPNTSHIA